MSDVPSYVAPFRLNEAMDGRSVGEVVASRSDEVAVGDLVTANLAWRTHGVVPAKQVQKVSPPDGVSPSAYLGVLGVPGLTAWVGLLDKAAFREGDVGVRLGRRRRGRQPRRAAREAQGRLARRGQRRQRRQGGLADRRAGLRRGVQLQGLGRSVTEQLREAMPDGVDVYFDNVGADHLEAAIACANDFARVAACGAIAHYNDTDENPTPGPANLFQIVKKRLSIQGFIVTDSIDRMRPFLEEVTPWVAEGRVKFAETTVEGIDRAVEAFRGMLRGENTGKMIVKV